MAVLFRTQKYKTTMLTTQGSKGMNINYSTVCLLLDNGSTVVKQAIFPPHSLRHEIEQLDSLNWRRQVIC